MVKDSLSTVAVTIIGIWAIINATKGNTTETLLALIVLWLVIINSKIDRG